jgi:acyl-CoA hydrolase
VHGGNLLKLVDQAGAIVVVRHTHSNVVTASVDRFDFISPAYIGNLVFIKASLNSISRTSMEVGVRVEAECLRTGTHTHIWSVYLTFVALDKNDKSTEVPGLIPETESEKRRYEEAKKRRETRLQRAKLHRHHQQACIIRANKFK